MRTAVLRRPSWRLLLDLASMELRQGQVDAARDHLEELLERFPESHNALHLLAELELQNGRPARAAELFRQLVERSPGLAELTNLGLAQLLLGDAKAAEASFRRALELEPDNMFAVLNLADATLLLGRDDAAARLYARVLELLSADPAADAWQAATVRAQALAHLGRSREAVLSVQEALRQAPENPNVAFEAALVFALVGDRVSALAHGERALAGGYHPGWFAFPWFDTLRDDPAFRSLVAAPPESPPR